MKTTEMKSPLFEVHMTNLKPIGLISIPHSGLEIPAVIKDFLIDDQHKLNCDVDFEVHQLIDIQALNEAGINVIKSNIHRTAIDLNRSRDIALLNWKKNSKQVPIVVQEPTTLQQEEFLATYYDPYFEMLKVMMMDLMQTAPSPASFVDLHSMPSEATEYHMKQNPDQEKHRPNFCLSDQFGETCQPEFINYITSKLKGYDYNVKINHPYLGGYITVHMDKYFTPINNIQIEINRALYMHEQKIELNSDKANDLKSKLTPSLIDLFKKFSQS